MRRRVLLMSLAALAAAGLASAATASNGGLAPPDAKSPNGEGILTTYWVLIALTGIVFVAVEAALVIFVVRYRSRNRDPLSEGPQIHGATRLELAWTIAPVVIIAAIVAFVFVKLPEVDHTPPANASSKFNVRVVGHQYYWQFEYPGGQISIDRLVVPVDQVVTLDVVSADVIHSWWVPEFGGKIDAIPGSPNQTWFRVKQAGTYVARCAELCGLEHAHMTGTVEVVDRAAFEAFLAEHQPGSAAVGKEAFTGVCAKCHALSGKGDYGPSLVGSGVITDQKALESLLRQGKGNMPAVGKTWSDDELKAVGDYLRSHFAQGGSSGS